jgi:histone H3/H4
MSKQPKEILIVGSKVKSVVSEAGCRSDGELAQAISDKVHDMLATAVARAKENGRSTVRPHDL